MNADRLRDVGAGPALKGEQDAAADPLPRDQATGKVQSAERRASLAITAYISQHVRLVFGLGTKAVFMMILAAAAICVIAGLMFALALATLEFVVYVAALQIAVVSCALFFFGLCSGHQAAILVPLLPSVLVVAYTVSAFILAALPAIRRR